MSDQSANREWVALSRTESATKASTDIYNILGGINLGQGRETVEWELLQNLVVESFSRTIAETQKLISSKYPAAVARLKENSAEFAKNILNVDAVPSSTFTFQNQGRGGLWVALALMAQNAGSGKKVLVPDTSWPMLNTLFKLCHLTPVFYSMEKGKIAGNIAELLKEHGDDVAALYISDPHNPTGTILSEEDYREIFQVTNAINTPEDVARRGHKIGIVADAPYPHSCNEIFYTDGRRALKTGYSSFTQEQITSWIMVISASKFFGTAEPGLTILTAHQEYQKALPDVINATIGNGFFTPYLVAVLQALEPENYASMLNHFATLREKYIANRKILEEALGDKVVPGDPGMTALIQLNPADYINRTMQKHDGSDFVIKDLNDVVEYLANKYGVITVNNNVPHKPDVWLLRLAAAEQPPAYAEGIKRLVTGLDEIHASPSRQLLPADAPDIALKQ